MYFQEEILPHQSFTEREITERERFKHNDCKNIYQVTMCTNKHYARWGATLKKEVEGVREKKANT